MCFNFHRVTWDLFGLTSTSFIGPSPVCTTQIGKFWMETLWSQNVDNNLIYCYLLITLLKRSFFLFFVHFKHKKSNAGQFARDTMDLSGRWGNEEKQTTALRWLLLWWSAELKFVAQFSTFHFQTVCEPMTDLILVDVGTFFVWATQHYMTSQWHKKITTLHFHITTADISTKHQQVSPALAWNERASSININVQFDKRFAVFGVFAPRWC